MNSPSVKSYKSQEDWLAHNSFKGLGSIYLVALLQLLWHENYCYHICNSTRGKRGMPKKYRFLFLQKEFSKRQVWWSRPIILTPGG